jgi:tetratricopeptide (TPR) repeat protein
MNNYQIISLLIPSLTEDEHKHVRKLIAIQGAQNNKLLKVFDEIWKKKNKGQEEIIAKVYGDISKANLDAFRKLCERLLLKIFDSLVENDDFKDDTENYSELFRSRQFVKRQILLYHFLVIKGLPDSWLRKFILKLIEICSDNEFLEDEFLLQRQLSLLHLRDNDGKGAIEINLTMEKLSKSMICVIKSEFHIFKYIDQVQYKSIDDRSLIIGMKEAIIEVKGYYNETKLNNILYFQLMLELQLSHYEENYTYAENLLFRLIHLTESNKSVRYLSRISINYMNLAYTQFFLHKFEEAFENSKKASKVFLTHVNDLNIYKEASVFALVYLKKYAEAEEVLQQILDSGSLGNKPEQLSKRHIIMAVIKYLQGEYKSAFKHLQQTKEVETDREGWNLGIRMMNIYLTLSTEKIELADQRIGSMRKHIERTAKMRHLRKRDVVIFRILSQLSRSGFDFKEVWEERRKDFNLLRSDQSDYRWVPRSHELIIFDQWFEARMKGIPYEPVFPKPAESKAVDKKSAE